MIRFPHFALPLLGPFRRLLATLWLTIGLMGLATVTGMAQGPVHIMLTVTNDVSIAWTWETQFMITATSAGNGVISGDSNGWYDPGTTVQIVAAPAPYYHFVKWTGDVLPEAETNATLDVHVDQPRTVTALFSENLATNSTPEWWLAAHGLTNQSWNAEAMDDQDHDGMLTWQEWVSDTDPTDSNSVLRVMAMEPDPGGMRISWEGGTGVWQYLERRQDLGLTNEPWTVIFSNFPPTTINTNRMDAEGTNAPLFYRIRAAR